MKNEHTFARESLTLVARRSAFLGRAMGSWLLALLLLLPSTVLPSDRPEPDWARIGAQAVELLARYIRIDTQNPPGVTVEAVNFLEQLLLEAGFETERLHAVPDKPILVGRLRGVGQLQQPIVLLNHTDVVPADPTTWSVPPFSGEIRNGSLYGRGTLDVKGFAIAQLAALRLLARRNEHPRHDIVFLAVPDEETGSESGLAWLSQHRPDLMNAAGVWDEGAFGLTDLLPRPVVFISVAEKRLLWIRLVAEGRAGHGSRPFPAAAPHRLNRALFRVLDQPPPSRLTPTARTAFRRLGRQNGGTRGFLMRHIDNPLIWPWARRMLERDAFAGPFIRDTIALTMLNAGYKPNIIPERAEAVLDCRLLPGTNQDHFLTELKRLAEDDGIRIEVVKSAELSPPSPVRNDLFRAIEAASRMVYPEAIVSPSMAVGMTDSRFFRQRRVPAYGFVPFVLSQDVVSTIHGVDERVPVAALGPAVRVVYEALRRL